MLMLQTSPASLTELLTLVAIHRNEHGIDAQNDSLTVTAKVHGTMFDAMKAVSRDETLVAFDIGPSVRLGLFGHIEFRTLKSQAVLANYFGLPM